MKQAYLYKDYRIMSKWNTDITKIVHYFSNFIILNKISKYYSLNMEIDW